jgi:hypothetical protein
MHELNLPRAGLEIREVLAEASAALARLDADRLEELAAACQALNRNRGPEDLSIPIHVRLNDRSLARQAREAASDMKAFGGVLEATRANLRVMRRLRQLRDRPIEYSEAQVRGPSPSEPDYGDN